MPAIVPKGAGWREAARLLRWQQRREHKQAAPMAAPSATPSTKIQAARERLRQAQYGR
jgi:hypothetical protein